jgi:hypothetical protein
MSDPYLSMQRQIQELQDSLERLRKADTPGVAGTYTPTYLGGTTPGVTTYSVQTGFYTRIGNIVVARGRVVWTAATGTGNARVSLPFAAGVYEYGSGSLWTDGVTFAAGSPQIQAPPSVAFFEMISPASNAGSTAVAVEAAGNIGFTVVYFV